MCKLLLSMVVVWVTNYLVVGSRVAKSMFSANTPARDKRFNNDDLPTVIEVNK